MVQANFDDTIPEQRHQLRASQRLPTNDKRDNLLRYQISADKEENSMLEAIIMTSSDKAKDGMLISTEAANKTQIV